MDIKLKNLSIRGIATAIPKQKFELIKLADQFGLNEINRIKISTGIDSVRLATPLQKTSDFCLAASRRLLEKLNILPDSIDAIIFISQTPDYKMPATSCILQHKLGLSKAALAFDINYGCSAYIYGLFQAGLLINSGSCKRVLLCTGDTITKTLDPVDQKSRLVFGDGGSATILEKGIQDMAFNIMTDGSGYKSLIIDKRKNGVDEYLFMNGSEIMEFALREVPGSISNVLSQMNWAKEEIGIFALHQANQFMVDYLRKKLNVKKERVPVAVKEYGNTGPASIPLTLCHYGNDFTEQSKAKVIMSGFGVGLSWGSVALDLNETLITDVVEI
jgi:3-oxoacyl-[acyl-carrier-protein] synthase-3